jgi:hypothetical protein
MKWVYDDGGCKAAGFGGDAGDCVARSIAIRRQTGWLLARQMLQVSFALVADILNQFVA